MTGCQRPEPIRIGYLGADLTDGGTEEMTLLGATLAVDEINSSGGVFARQLALVRANYQGDRQRAVTEATKLCTEDRVTAIIGDLPTDIMRLVTPVSQANRVVAVSSGAVGRGIEEAGDCVFRTIPAEEEIASMVTRFLIEGCGWKSFTLAGDAGEAGAAYVLELYRVALTAGGAHIAASVTVDPRNPAKPATDLADVDQQAVVYVGSARDAAAFLGAAHDAGVTSPVYVVGAGIDSLLLAATVSGGDVIVVSGYDPGRPDDAQRKFHARFVAKYGRDPDAAAARGYDAVKLVAAAMLEARGTKTDLFAQTMATVTGRAGASGTLTYLADTRRLVCEPMYVLRLSGGESVLLGTLSRTAK